MFKQNLKTLITFFLLLTCFPAFSQTFKISTLYPDGTEILVELKKAAKEIQTKTDGRVKFKFYPGGVMGDDKAVFRKIRIGQLHGAILQSGAVAQFYKDSQIYVSPLLFKNFEEVDYVRSKMDQKIIDGLDKSGWTTFGLIDGGFAYAMSGRPVKNIGDLRKQKLWLPANDPISEKIAESIDVNPIVLNIGEVHTALQTNAINAFAAPPIAALTLRWSSKVSYITDIPLMYAYGLMTIQKKSFSKLSQEDQILTQNILSQVFQKLDTNSRKDSIKAFSAVLGQGVEPVVPDEKDQMEWKFYAEKVTRDLVAKKEYSQEILDEVSQLLEDFRNKQQKI
ncbi:hypothetical protein MACH09_08130 [Vibrio sp. MACH09]|uniref:TRAP transporter substrate-binding protein n=1 Tax=Vibrio sp. MACH09 TaxID=3025122 RepID=UPI00279363FD|nr:TRAP transporter substrate-binding protein DctP [Vibrio sp. MACH09]GLO60305.1 hypothetical protein MACH09_08130 [Vibrio sp. MACH09]